MLFAGLNSGGTDRSQYQTLTNTLFCSLLRPVHREIYGCKFIVKFQILATYLNLKILTNMTNISASYCPPKGGFPHF